MTCKICGAEMPNDAIFCPSCGCNNAINSTNTVNNASVWQPPKELKSIQKARLIIEIIICAIMIFCSVMVVLFGTAKGCGVIMILISGALFYLLYKNPPQTKETRINAKLQGAGRVILIIACMLAAFIFMFKGMIG